MSIAHRKNDEEYIPPHLQPFVHHSHDDFYVSRSFDPVLLCHLMYEGFLPIATEYGDQLYLLPKLHRKRCVLIMNKPEHVPKSVKKRSKKYKLVFNNDFDGVIKGCHAQHGIPWLYPPLVEGFRTLCQADAQGVLHLSGIELWDLGMSMPYKMSLGASDVDQ
jgi:Leu/Phe-tRNA-protein transferase